MSNRIGCSSPSLFELRRHGWRSLRSRNRTYQQAMRGITGCSKILFRGGTLLLLPCCVSLVNQNSGHSPRVKIFAHRQGAGQFHSLVTAHSSVREGIVSTLRPSDMALTAYYLGYFPSVQNHPRNLPAHENEHTLAVAAQFEVLGRPEARASTSGERDLANSVTWDSREIPSTLRRAGSSLRLKGGSAQDNALRSQLAPLQNLRLD